MNCRNAQPRLSEFLDNKLSARATWEVDLHLADCHECTRILNEMRRTVDLVVGAPRYEVSDDFIQNLQSRIGGLEPAAPRWAWIDAVRSAFRPRVLPVWGAAMVTGALAIVMLVPRTEPSSPTPSSQQSSPEVRHATGASVALSATDPFADLGVANLAAHFSDKQTISE